MPSQEQLFRRLTLAWDHRYRLSPGLGGCKEHGLSDLLIIFYRFARRWPRRKESRPYSRFHVILQNSRFISQISFHFFVSFFNFSSHGRVDLAPGCPSRQSTIIFRKISAIRLKMVCCMPLSSHKKVPYSKERQRLHAFCHGVPRGFFRAFKALD